MENRSGGTTNSNRTNIQRALNASYVCLWQRNRIQMPILFKFSYQLKIRLSSNIVEICLGCLSSDVSKQFRCWDVTDGKQDPPMLLKFYIGGRF